MKAFEVIVLGIFVALAVVGVIVFATIGPLGSGEKVGRVVIWGTIDDNRIKEVIRVLDQEHGGFEQVRYEERDAQTYYDDLVNALAAGRGPDLFLIEQDRLFEHADKVFPIPSDVMSERAFRDTYIQGADVFMVEDGILGLPLAVDPLVLYWNRNLFSSAGFAQPPRTWEELFAAAPKLSRIRDETNTVTQSAVALGTFSNVRHAKEILSALILQTGVPIIGTDPNTEQLAVILKDRRDGESAGAEAAVRFFTTFADPATPVYSWNKSLNDSRNEFVAGDLAVYFGLASELPLLRRQNPNLNFDVAEVPQATTETRVTFGKITGIAVARGSDNPQGAMQVARLITSTDGISAYIEEGVTPPVRRDLLAATPEDAFRAVFRSAALTARAWLDPGAEASAAIFSRMIEDVTSGRANVREAVETARRELSALIGAR